ncbi:MAG: Hsp20/alpha crystallin family protein [Nitrospinae bacterium]|nr:Hsp20/alpha crystallin family protein [Nitrospinota bacterium]
MSVKKRSLPEEIAVKRDETIDRFNYTYLKISTDEYALGETSFINLDLYETSDYFFIEAELPGVLAEDMKIYMTGDSLVIEGAKYEQIESEGRVNFLCMERSFGPFKRTVNIRSAVDKSHIKASYSKGILIIQIPKSKERREKTRWIEVEKGKE